MKRPSNLLFILSDNHNRSLLGCYGHPQVRTPNLDQIASIGTRFDNAYSSSPLCCPARAALATGRFPHQTGYWDNAIVYDGRVPAWMHRLRNAGVETVSIGKLHFRSAEDDNGFSKELIPMHITEGRGAVQNLLRGYDAELNGLNAKRWELYLDKSGIGETHYQEYDVDITRHAIDWLTSRSSRSEPWALFVSYVSPHPPFTVPQRFMDLYPPEDIVLPPHCSPGVFSQHPGANYHREKFSGRGIPSLDRVKKMIAAYYGLITHVDEQIGMVLDALRKSGLAGDTTLVYSSDHGEMRGAHGLLGKGLMYEDAVAVPLIIAQPGAQNVKSVSQIVSHTDVYPTLLDYFGVPLAEFDHDLPGISLLPAVRGAQCDRSGFAEYHANFSQSGIFMLREGPLKYVYHVGMPAQLFNLDTDPNELCDLAGKPDMSGAISAMEQRLRAICDPEAVDQRAKADQRRLGDSFGGIAALAAAPSITFSPPPGVDGAAIGSFVPGTRA